MILWQLFQFIPLKIVWTFLSNWKLRLFLALSSTIYKCDCFFHISEMCSRLNDTILGLSPWTAALISRRLHQFTVSLMHFGSISFNEIWGGNQKQIFLFQSQTRRWNLYLYMHFLKWSFLNALWVLVHWCEKSWVTGTRGNCKKVKNKTEHANVGINCEHSTDPKYWIRLCLCTSKESTQPWL